MEQRMDFLKSRPVKHGRYQYDSPLNNHFRQTFPWLVPLGTTLPKSQESWTQFKNKIPSIYTLVYFIGLGGLYVPHLFTHS
jgi:hypothetical protein